MGGPKAGPSRSEQLEDLLTRMGKLKDYWQVRALRAEGYDIPEREHPAKTMGVT